MASHQVTRTAECSRLAKRSPNTACLSGEADLTCGITVKCYVVTAAPTAKCMRLEPGAGPAPSPPCLLTAAPPWKALVAPSVGGLGGAGWIWANLGNAVARYRRAGSALHPRPCPDTWRSAGTTAACPVSRPTWSMRLGLSGRLSPTARRRHSAASNLQRGQINTKQTKNNHDFTEPPPVIPRGSS